MIHDTISIFKTMLPLSTKKKKQCSHNYYGQKCPLSTILSHSKLFASATTIVKHKGKKY